MKTSLRILTSGIIYSELIKIIFVSDNGTEARFIATDPSNDDRGIFIILKDSGREERRKSREFASLNMNRPHWFIKKEPVEHYRAILKNGKYGDRYELTRTLYSKKETEDEDFKFGRFSSREFIRFDTENPIMLEPL